MDVGKEYIIIYDDKSHHPAKKIGKIIGVENNLIFLEGGEILNMRYIIRMKRMEGGKNDTKSEET